MSFLDCLAFVIFLGLGHFLCLHLMLMWNSDLFYALYIDKSINFYLLKKYYKKKL